MAFIKFELMSGGEMFISPGSVYRVTAEPAAGATRVDAGPDSPVVAMPVEKVVSLLQQAGVKLVELMRAEGSPVHLNVMQISLVRDSQGGDPVGTNAVVMVSGKRQAVAQTPRRAHDMIRAASAPAGSAEATS